jgi:hypothetical protein
MFYCSSQISNLLTIQWISPPYARVCLVQKRGGDERDFNEGEGREGEGRRNLLTIYMFGSKEGRGREERDFNCKCVWFMRGGDI